MSKKSFTLVELMVVVAIISILAAGLLVGLGGARKKARDSRRISDLRNVQAALEVYYSQNNKYPSATDWPSLEGKLKSAGITSRLPDDPISGQHYDYTDCDSQQRYIIRAQLEDPTHNCPPNYSPPDTAGCSDATFSCPADCSWVCISFK